MYVLTYLYILLTFYLFLFFELKGDRFLKIFYWNIVNFKYSVSSVQQSESVTHVHISMFF